MHPSETNRGPSDRENALLVVLIALASLPAIFLGWVWLARVNGDVGRALVASLIHARGDPLVLAAAANLCLLLPTIAVWVWRDGGSRGVGPAARLAWGLVLVCLGALGLWMYLAVRPPLRREGCASSR